jgi:hypothetical protein
MGLETTRRGLLLGGAALIAAPAIVRYANLMPVKVFDEWQVLWQQQLYAFPGVGHMKLYGVNFDVPLKIGDTYIRGLKTGEIPRDHDGLLKIEVNRRGGMRTTIPNLEMWGEDVRGYPFSEWHHEAPNTGSVRLVYPPSES